MKLLLAKEFETRIKKQEEVIKQLNEAHAKKLQLMKQSTDKEKQEIQQKFEREVTQQKSTSKQQLLIMERKQRFAEEQKQKKQAYEVDQKVQAAIKEQEKKQNASNSSQITSQKMIAGLQDKLKKQYESLLEQKVKEQEELGNESARNLNDLMRKRRTEFKQEKAKLEDKIKVQEQMIQKLQLTLKDMKATFSDKIKEAMSQSASHQNSVNQEVTALRDQVSQMTKESAQLEQLLGQKDSELKARMQEAEQKEGIIKKLEENDQIMENILKEKKIIDASAKGPAPKKQKETLKNGSAGTLQPLSERIKTKFDKLLEANESKVADLEYTIDSKDDELASQKKQIAEFEDQIKKLVEKAVANDLGSLKKHEKSQNAELPEPKKEEEKQ